MSVSNEYEDKAEWQKQAKYWLRRYGHILRWPYSLVQCKHITVINGDVVETNPAKVYVFPCDEVLPLSFDETDRLLGNE